jgi:hypothetical protein
MFPGDINETEIPFPQSVRSGYNRRLDMRNNADG